MGVLLSRNQASETFLFSFSYDEIPTKMNLSFVGDGLFFWALQN